MIFDVTVNDIGNVRPPRCPHQVLERAVLFALTQNFSHIWVNQECIDQNDATDVQNHLQCMHKIFNRAKNVIGLLNFEVADWTQMLALENINTVKHHLIQEPTISSVIPPMFTNVKLMKYLMRLLKSIHLDRWFTRTWVFQERYSSLDALVLLLRPSASLKQELLAKCPNKLEAEHVYLHAQRLVCLAAVWAAMLKKFKVEDIEVRGRLGELHRVAMTLCGHLDSFSLDTLANSLLTDEKLSIADCPSDGFVEKDIFRAIESCDNRVVSDRLAILANITKLKLHIPAIMQKSYSMSILQLLLVNECFPRILITTGEHLSKDRLGTANTIQSFALATQVFELKELQREGMANAVSEIRLLTDFLWTAVSLDLSNIENLYDLLQLLGLSPLLLHVMNGMAAVPVIPTSMPISDWFDGIISRLHHSRRSVSSKHGEMIVQYAIDHGQLPYDTKFLSFFGKYYWSSKFVEEHFRI
jgi:hypothetical protein